LAALFAACVPAIPGCVIASSLLLARSALEGRNDAQTLAGLAHRARAFHSAAALAAPRSRAAGGNNICARIDANAVTLCQPARARHLTWRHQRVKRCVTAEQGVVCGTIGVLALERHVTIACSLKFAGGRASGNRSS